MEKMLAKQSDKNTFFSLTDFPEIGFTWGAR